MNDYTGYADKPTQKQIDRMWQKIKREMQKESDKEEMVTLCSSCKRAYCEHYKVGDTCPKCGGMIIKVKG